MGKKAGYSFEIVSVILGWMVLQLFLAVIITSLSYASNATVGNAESVSVSQLNRETAIDGLSVDTFFAGVNNCTDVSGDWDVSTRGTIKCSGGGETEKEKVSGSGTVAIEQNGCKVSWSDPEYDESRKGSVKGRRIKVSGKYAISLVSGVKFTQNTYTATGIIDGDTIKLRGKGKVAGSYQGVSFTCEGSDRSTFTRSSDEEDYVRKPSVKKKTRRKSAASVYADSVKNIPKCVPIKIIGR